MSLISGATLFGGVSISPRIPEPRPDSSNPSEVFRWAIRNVIADGPNGPRSLEYYASVGIDHFSHDHDNLQRLIDSIAAELEPPNAD